MTNAGIEPSGASTQGEREEPGTAKALVDRGFERIDERQLERAIEYFDGAIDLELQNARAFFGRAVAWHHLDETENALCDYDQAIRLDPNLAGAFLNRGSLRYARGEREEAIADYSEAIRLNPNDGETVA
jgi:tetratricopeptide (TPR) repeat protein